EAVHVGVEYADGVTPLGESHREVGGDARLAHAPLARGDQEGPGARVRFGEGDAPALGVPLRRLGAGRGVRIAVEALAECGQLVVGHHREVEGDGLDSQWGARGADKWTGL